MKKDNFYYDISAAIARMKKKNCIVGMVLGGRGIGKTYSALSYVVDNQIKHIYLRRSDAELQVVASDAGNPYKSINKDKGTDISIESRGKIKLVVNNDTGDILGYALALSTFGNVRGVDFTDVTMIVFDEFVPQPGVVQRKSENIDAFYNMYESVNRNRELRGEPPLIVIMLSNAVSIASPITTGMGVVPEVENMLFTGQHIRVLRDRHIYIEICGKYAVSDEKAKTPFYQLCDGSDYYAHAIDNDFAYDSFYNVGSKVIAEYLPICGYDDIYFYQHKHRDEYYASYTRQSCPTFTKDTRAYFMLTYSDLLSRAYASGRLYFESYDIKKRAMDLLEM